ncbi:hypothetical protein ACFQ2B_13100 [Streptomyces stramineus]|uniref:hypothetical protein n=1 Tax=Streptomyces sp. NPDC046215 TaxID=3155774 RepID=UPI0033D86107
MSHSRRRAGPPSAAPACPSRAPPPRASLTPGLAGAGALAALLALAALPAADRTCAAVRPG